MAGPRPTDQYSPLVDREPSAGMPNDYLSVRANPESFGSQIGQATEKLGQTVSQGAELINNEALKVLQQQQDTNAALGSTDYANWAASKTYEFQQLKGMNMVNAWPQFQHDLDQEINQRASSIHSPYERLEYLRDTRSFQQRTVESMSHYVADAFKQGTKEADEGQMHALINQVVVNPQNTAGLMSAIPQMQDLALKAADHEGITDPNAAIAYIQQAETNMIESFIYSQMKVSGSLQNQLNSIETAQQTLDTLKDQTLPGHPDAPLLGDKGNTISRIQGNLNQQKFYLQAKVNNQAIAGNAEQSLNEWNLKYQSGNSATATNPNFGEKDAQISVDRLIPGATITSEARTPEHNKAIGGVPDSMHLSGQAIDFVLPKGVTFEQAKEKFESEGLPVTEFINEGNHVHWGWASKDSTKTDPSLMPHYAYLEQHLLEIVEGSVDKTVDAETQDKQRNFTRTRVMAEINNEKTALRGASDGVINWLLTSGPNGGPQTSMAAIEGAPDDIKGAADTLQKWDGAQWKNIREKLFKANAGGKATNLGSEFWHLYSRAMSGEDLSAKDLLNYVDSGKDAALTNTGLQTLMPLLSRNQTAEGKAFNDAERQFFASHRGAITGTGISPWAHDPTGDVNMSKFMALAMPMIEFEWEHGTPASKIFDPKGDIAGLVPQFQRSRAQLIKGTLKGNAADTYKARFQNPAKPTVYTSRDQLMADAQAKKISQADFMKIAHQHPDWWTPKGEEKPQVPQATFSEAQ